MTDQQVLDVTLIGQVVGGVFIFRGERFKKTFHKIFVTRARITE